ISSDFSQTITVLDGTAPVVLTPSGSLDATVDCSDSAGLAAALSAFPIASDACDATPTMTLVGNNSEPGPCTGSYVLLRIWNFTDDCGNISSDFSQTITVLDETAPVLSGQGSASTIDCPSIPVFIAPTATDVCDASPVITFTDATVTGSCVGSYKITRTWLATDACGNTSLPVSQTITVQDVTAPVVLTPAGSLNATVECSDPTGLAEALAAFPTATDACDATPTMILVGNNSELGLCPGAYVLLRIWNFTDDCGNISSDFSQTITVLDATAPVLSGQGLATTLDCPSIPVFIAPAATDVCDASPIITFSDATVMGACAGSYAITRTWLAKDACGNISLPVSQSITVQDITPPVLSGEGADLTIECPSIPVFTSPIAIDACGSLFTITSEDITTIGACAGSYGVKRTWTATDDCGNSSSASQTINVQDNTAPVISPLPSPVTINCPLTPVFAVVTVIDACENSFTLSSSDITTLGACAGSYSITRIWTATDDCGNSSTALQTINVQDITPPVITATGTTLSLGCNPSPEDIEAALGTATATDDCSPYTLTTNDGILSGSPCLQSQTRIFNATDDCGNSALQVSRKVTWSIDTEAPVITATGTTLSLGCNPKANEIEAALGTATADDNCTVGIPDITDGPINEGPSCLLSRKRTFNVEDKCGNAALEVSRTVTWTIDNDDPVISGTIANILINGCNASDAPVAVSTFEELQSLGLSIHDICTADGSLVVTSFDVVSGLCPAIILRTYIITDACTNSATASQVITVQDIVAPVIMCPDDITILYSESTAPSHTGIAIALDNCDQSPLLNYADFIPFNPCASDKLIIRTWMTVDKCGNSTTCQQRITFDERGTICGSVSEDTGLPLPGVEIRLEADINANQIFDAGDTLVAVLFSDVNTGQYCFQNIRPCNFILVRIQTGSSVDLYDYDFTPDPDGDDSSDGPDSEIPVTLSPGENDADNNFIEKTCSLLVSNTQDKGQGSLRNAIECAVAGDTIRFASSLAARTITITSARIEINKEITIYSTLSPRVTISSQIPGLFRITSDGVVKFVELNIVSGTNIAGNLGSAFENSGNLKLHNVDICRRENLPVNQYVIRNMPGAMIFVTGYCAVHVDCYTNGFSSFQY
ncbi:MAG: hypothetical protein WAT91_09985, partial [Saprospiraceae bacterium]